MKQGSDTRRETPRSCLRCLQEKVPEDFPIGKSYRRRSSICWVCQEVEAYVVEATREGRKATWKVKGRTVRRCSDCRKVKRLSGGFPKRGGYRCRRCESKRVQRYVEALPEEVRKAKKRDLQRRWRAENPEVYKAQVKRHYERVAQDPERKRKRLEDQRMHRRLRRERAGLTNRAGSYGAAMAETNALRRIPAEPLLGLIDARTAQREAVNRFIGDDQQKQGAAGEVCEQLRITLRAVYRLRHEQAGVTVELAERVIVAADLEWEDVYSYDDHRDLYAEGAALAHLR